MATGSLNDGIPYNCRSFSKLSLIIEDYPGLGLAPVLPSSYNIDCTNEIQQIIDFNLVGNDGIKVIKLWAKDSSGQISADSKNILINLDRTLPQINLTTFTNNVLLKGGQTIPITWTSFDINSETHPITIDYTADGINWMVRLNNLWVIS